MLFVRGTGFCFFPSSRSGVRSGRLKRRLLLTVLTLPRIAMQLGLRDLVVHQCSNFNCTSMLPPRMLPLPNTLIDQEEKTRAYWMTEILDGSSTMGVAWNVSLTRPPPSILPSASATASQTNSASLPYEQNMPWLAFGDELWTTMPELVGAWRETLSGLPPEHQAWIFAENARRTYGLAS